MSTQGVWERSHEETIYVQHECRNHKCGQRLFVPKLAILGLSPAVVRRLVDREAGRLQLKYSTKFFFLFKLVNRRIVQYSFLLPTPALIKEFDTVNKIKYVMHNYRTRPKVNHRNITLAHLLQIAAHCRNRKAQLLEFGFSALEISEGLIRDSGSVGFLGTVKEVLGTCVSMNCTIENIPAKQVLELIEEFGDGFVMQMVAMMSILDPNLVDLLTTKNWQPKTITDDERWELLSPELVVHTI